MASSVNYYQNNRNTSKLDISQIITPLNSKDRKELEKILEDETEIISLIHNSDQFKSLNAEKESLLTAIRSQAENNLSLKPQLDEAKETLIRLQGELGEVLNQHQNLVAQIDSLSDKRCPETILAILKTSAVESEDRTEDLAEKFMDASIDCESFLDLFLTERKLAHLRRLKSEKFSEMLNNGEIAMPSSVSATRIGQTNSVGIGGIGGGQLSQPSQQTVADIQRLNPAAMYAPPVNFHQLPYQMPPYPINHGGPQPPMPPSMYGPPSSVGSMYRH